jgi:hypothetical protein
VREREAEQNHGTGEDANKGFSFHVSVSI